jgi:protein subunit release factor A
MPKELLFSITKEDFEITYFSGTGSGGQHRNKHMNCVRIKHPPSGVMVTGQAERSLEQNKKFAFNSLIEHPKFKTWLKIETAKACLSREQKIAIEKEILTKVEKAMNDKNLLIETFDVKNKKWVKENVDANKE